MLVLVLSVVGPDLLSPGEDGVASAALHKISRAAACCQSTYVHTYIHTYTYTVGTVRFAKKLKKDNGFIAANLGGLWRPRSRILDASFSSPATVCGTTWETPAYCQKNRCMVQFIVACMELERTLLATQT